MEYKIRKRVGKWNNLKLLYYDQHEDFYIIEGNYNKNNETSIGVGYGQTFFPNPLIIPEPFATIIKEKL